MRTTVSILPFVKRQISTSDLTSELPGYANSNERSPRNKSACPHCGGLLLPGESAADCSSAPKMVRPACVLVTGKRR
jgi:hypothetical protein